MTASSEDRPAIRSWTSRFFKSTSGIPWVYINKSSQNVLSQFVNINPKGVESKREPCGVGALALISFMTFIDIPCTNYLLTEKTLPVMS